MPDLEDLLAAEAARYDIRHYPLTGIRRRRQHRLVARAGGALAAVAVLGAAGLLLPGLGQERDAVPNGPEAASFASFVGVLGCAELVVWGNIEARDQVDEGLEVTFGVEEWVHPGTGAERITFIADDPAVEVGAPEWDPSEQRVLVVVSEHAPTARSAAAEGERAVEQWRDAGSPRLTDEQCRGA